MEHSISSLAFKGSIIEAITEAKRQKKLFVVYVSGENEDSISMDKTTWSESSVAESLPKYCILLHILEGSTDAAQFFALYPQKPAPCITAIGYNGVQLWQNEGFVSAEVLASTLEKAWLSLHVQETTATFLTAALASRQSDQIPSETRGIGTSSTSSNNTNVNASVHKKDLDDHKEKTKIVEKKKSKINDNVDVSQDKSVDKLEESNSKQLVITSHEPVNQVTRNASEPGVDQNPRLTVSQHESKPEKSENIQIEKVDSSTEGSKISSDIYLNIRLPGGASLQEKFEPTTTLKMVKDYVDENQESSIGSYDLAVPYPRKVFSDQDLTKSLTELSLLNRQALIVVPHLRSSGPQRGRSSVSNPSASAGPTRSADSESYFSLLKQYLSYVNPLAYLNGGGADTSAAANSSTSGTGSRRSYLVTSNQSSNNTATSTKKMKPNASRFGSGSNIHTLKHDEDDTKFKGQNAFWNGNSTEYGGDDADNK